MKKFLSLVAIAAMAALGMTSCSSNDDEPSITYYTVNFEESYFTALIDNPQYGGPLIYSANEYKWQDKETTLSSTCEKDDWSQWGMGWGWKNGIAISNYVDATASSYDKQLAVPVKSTTTGNNFAVVWDDNSELTFADGQAHTIVSMDVINTSYALANIKKNMHEGYSFKVVCKFYGANNQVTEDSFFLAKDNDVVEKWQTIRVNVGPVKKIVFSFEGTDKGDYGLLTPKYFAIDNIVVVK